MAFDIAHRPAGLGTPQGTPKSSFPEGGGWGAEPPTSPSLSPHPRGLPPREPLQGAYNACPFIILLVDVTVHSHCSFANM